MGETKGNVGAAWQDSSGSVLSQENLQHHIHLLPSSLACDTEGQGAARPRSCGINCRGCSGHQHCHRKAHSQHPQSQALGCGFNQHKWRLKLMPAQRECAAFCWLSQLVSQFPRMPAVCRRGWSSQAIRSKKTLSASLLFSSIYNYCVRELHNL